MGARAWTIAMCIGCAAGACSSSPSIGDPGSEAPGDQPDPSSAPEEDAGKPSCVVEDCPTPGLGLACCTTEGTGEPGNILEPVGRGPGHCGSNLGAIADSLEDVCVQLSQPGETDPSCPGQARENAPVMPGCCTDQGFCGSIDELAPFGCFYATGMRGVPCGSDVDADGGI